MDMSAGKKIRELTATRANKKTNKIMAGKTFCLINCIINQSRERSDVMGRPK